MRFNQHYKMAQGSNKGLLTLNIVQLIIIGVLAYLLFDSNQKIDNLNTSVSTKSEEIDGLKSDIMATRENLEKIKAEREALGLSIDSLNSEISQLDDVVARLETKNNISRAEIKKLNSKVANLNLDIEKQRAEIVQLKKENQVLVQNVDSLSKQNTALNENVEQLSVEKDHLQRDLKIASILSAQGIEVVGLKDNDKEITDQPFKASKLDRFKVTFTIADNKVAEHNKKRFYLRLITPSGECFSDSRNGGGVTKDHEGSELKYTMSKELLFENTSQWLSMVMLKGFNYTPGNYIIQIYCEGYDIGQTSFIVK